MYYNANDYELIYLIRDGNPQATKTLYEKYEHLIFKIYHNKYKFQGLVFLDFKQECLMILTQAIYLFNDKYHSSFCNFYLVLVYRRMNKLYRKDAIRLKEKYTNYFPYEYFEKSENKSLILNNLLKDLKDISFIEKKILEECILDKGSIKNFSLKYGLSYYEVYKKTRKLKEKIENLLTNALN